MISAAKNDIIAPFCVQSHLVSVNNQVVAHPVFLREQLTHLESLSKVGLRTSQSVPLDSGVYCCSVRGIRLQIFVKICFETGSIVFFHDVLNLRVLGLIKHHN